MKLCRPAQCQISRSVKAEFPNFRPSPDVKALAKHKYPYRLRFGAHHVFNAEETDSGLTIVRIE